MESNGKCVWGYKECSDCADCKLYNDSADKQEQQEQKIFYEDLRLEQMEQM